MKQAYIVGGGIASLATAAYLLRDGLLSGSNIHIFEESALMGGSMDGAGAPDKAYVIRGGRMLNFTYRCLYDLLSFIPSLTDSERSVLSEMKEFNQNFKTHAGARLVENRDIRDASQMGLSMNDRLNLTRLMLQSEESCEDRTIQDFFDPEFFSTNFWLMWASMFAFEPWHSAAECRRYLHRFIHEFPRIHTLAGVDRTPYNQYDSIIRPLEEWLKKQGVHFVLNTEVRHLEIEEKDGKKTVTRLDAWQRGENIHRVVRPQDLVFITNGSMTAASTLGSMYEPAPFADLETCASWTLWKDLAQDRPEFGRPDVFSERVDESQWLSFTVTCRDPLFFELMEKFSGNEAGTGALVTFKDSPWLMSVVLPHQPHFINQPESIKVFWGYGLFFDQIGRFVRKPMSDCSGVEILEELMGHLPFPEKAWERIRATSTCIPCRMPYITSQFLTRLPGDRPAVIPEGSQNLAFIGQFCEIPDDVVFTVEYSVRSAMIAVYGLLKLDKVPPALYRGDHQPKVLLQALQTMLT